MSNKKEVFKQHKKLHVKTGDKVSILAGDEKGKTGTIVRVLKEKNRVIVEGLNLAKKAVKPSQQNQEGGFIQIEASIHISNVMLIDPKTNQPSRIGRRLNEKTGKLERYAKKSNTSI
jgi:large subunit ribosomal protein L24